MSIGNPDYFDLHATTPVVPSVAEAMQPYWAQMFGNMSSPHAAGLAARIAVGRARARCAALIGASAREIIFTSGATEANNLAIKGFLAGPGAAGRHIITSAIEHQAVLATCRYLERRGCATTVVPVGADGRVDPEAVRQAIRRGTHGTTARTGLISIMGANNEIGTVQPVAAIATIAAEAGIPMHCDGAQWVGKLPIDVRDLPIAMLSFTAHKIYGPKGVGALFVRRDLLEPTPKLDALLHGGGQEQGLRSGTIPVPLVVGLGAACRRAQDHLAHDATHTRQLRDRLLERLRATYGESLVVNGSLTHRLPGNLHITLRGVDPEVLHRQVRRFAVSSSSACSSAAGMSHVMAALGRTAEDAARCLRIGIGHQHTTAQVDRLAAALEKACAHQRSAVFCPTG